MEEIKKILVVEDEQMVANVLLDKLVLSGYSTENAKNGEDALKLLRKGHYDMVLLDLVMPKMDGFALLKKLKEENISTPVIAFSNLSESEDVAKAKELGVRDFFLKADTKLSDIVEYIRKEFSEHI